MRQVFDIIIVGGSFAGIKSAWDLRNKIPRPIKFEKLFFSHRGNIGELHRKMIK